jgi:shikimate dehydrogenase
MKGRLPLVIVTLPARSIPGLREEVRLAQDAGADGAEVRLDRLPPDELARLGELFPSPLPLIATLRSRIEGGEGPDDAASRIGPLQEAATKPFEWIDLEYDRDRELVGQFPVRGGAILSTHLTAADASDLERRMRQGTPPGSVRKIVLPASVGALLSRVLPAIPPPGEVPLTLLTTGGSGPLLRAWSKRLGLPLVFACLPQGPPRSRGPAPVESGQIPADRLRWFLDAETDAPIFGIAGHPVAHSASPYLHSRWMRHGGRRGLYVSLDFASDDEFVDSLPILSENGFRGLNVTHPFKETAFASASRVGRGAEACGVANCLTFRGGEVEAENTDLAAILRRLEELRAQGTWNGRTITVLGAGGAARATLAAAQLIGAHAYVVARRPESVRALIESFGAESGPPREPAAGDLVVHATDVGRAGAGALELSLDSVVRRSTHVVDWVYRPDDPVVRIGAERAGASYEDGWRLLVYQAAASFAVWWDEAPSAGEVTSAIEEGA